VKNEIVSNINCYDDLKLAKSRLKLEIKQQEESFKDNSILRIASSLFTGGRPTNAFKKPLSFASIKSPLSFSSENNLMSIAENLLGTFLITNKLTRKYFIAYTIAKEMIPFTLQKVNELLKK